MRGKKATLIAGVCATVAMSAVDTLKIKGMFELMQDPNDVLTTMRLHSIGVVKNGIIYGSLEGHHQEPTDSVLIWDAKKEKGGYLGTISRPGSNFEGVFPMKLKGDTLIYTDSTDLIATLVTDPAKPVQLWKKIFPGEIDNILYPSADTMYITRFATLATQSAFYKLHDNGSTEPTLVSSYKYLHLGETRLADNRLIGFATNYVYSWDGTLTERMPDGSFDLGYSPISVATQGKYSYCTNGRTIYVYDHTNMSTFALKDSAVGGGYTSCIYKDLLIVGGGAGASIGIYDISNAPTITKLATVTETSFGDHNSLAVDPVTNLLYGIDYNGGGGNWIRVYDINKYIPIPPVNTKPTVKKGFPETTTLATPIAFNLEEFFSDAETPTGLTFAVVSNSNSSAATASVDNKQLFVANGTVNGSTTVVISATDPKGLSVQSPLKITRNMVGISATPVASQSTITVNNQIISLSIGGKMTALSVVDLRGRELFRQNITGSSVTLPALGAAVQILRIETTSGVQMVKRNNEK